MTELSTVVEELESLPPERFDEAAEYVHRLKERIKTERDAVIERTAGCLEGDIGESFAKAIEEGCERVDPNGW